MKPYFLTFLFVLTTLNSSEIPETDIIEESGDFVDRMNTSIGLMPKQWNNLSEGTTYTDPSTSDLNGMVSDVFTPLKNSSFETAATNAKTYGYRLVKFLETSVSVTYYILERDPSSTSNNYWGTYVFNPAAQINDLIIQSPHPSFDAFTGKEGAYVYRQTGASFFFMSGAHRCNSAVISGCDGTSNVCNNSVSGVAPPASFLTDSGKFRKADMAHNDKTVFQKFTENLYDSNADYYFVQLHGFGRNSTDPHAILSNGRDEYTTPPNVDHLAILRTNLISLWAQLSGSSETFEVEVGHDDPDHNFGRLLGSTNTQGRYINGSSDPCGTSALQNTGHFLHIEQGSKSGNFYLREEENFSILGFALKSTFGDNTNPVFTSSDMVSFTENGIGTAYAAVATDENTVSYSLGIGNDNGLFDIVGNSGIVTFKNSPDFESPHDSDNNNTYVIDVEATDGTNAVVQTVTITVTNLDDTAPVFISATTVNFEENGTGMAYTAIATDANTINYSLGTGNDNALFDIVSSSGVVTFKNSPDFESPHDSDNNNTYVIDVEATDGTNAVVQTVTITVTNLDDTTPVFISATTVNFEENGTGMAYTAIATDANTINYSLGTGNDNALFDIVSSSGVVTFKNAPDFESPNDSDNNNVYVIEVKASDGTNMVMQTVTITVTDIDDTAPVFISAASTDFSENGVGIVYTAVATDVNTVSYSLGIGNDNALFDIVSSSGIVTFKIPPDFEVPTDSDANGTYVIELRASDGVNLVLQTVTITVTDIDDTAPVFTSATSTDFSENGVGVVYTAVATDANTVSYSLGTGNDNALFDIVSSSGVVSFKNAPDFESPSDSDNNNVYVIEVKANDGTSIVMQTVMITVTDIDDTAPVFASATTVNFEENGTGTAYTAVATDANTVNYSLGTGNDNGLFEIVSSSGIVTFKTPPDYESPHDSNADNSYVIELRANDGINTSIRGVIITITDVDETIADFVAPVFTSSTTINFVENGLGVAYTAVATDANTISYSLSTGVDNGLFHMNSNTGEVTFKTPPDFESPDDFDSDNKYDIGIEANDGVNKTLVSVSINVTDIDDTAPVFISATSVNFEENGTGAVYTPMATDMNTLTYSLISGNDSELFNIVGNEGVILFKDSPDFELPIDQDANNTYIINVEANDGFNTARQTVIITVIDVDEIVPVFTSETSVFFEEGSTEVAYTALVTDDGIITYSLDTGNDNVLFDIDSNSGQVTFKITPDYESPNDLDANNIYLIDVIVKDKINTVKQSVTITVTDIDEIAPEMPVISGITNDTGVLENDGVTNDTGIVLMGVAEAGSSLEVFLNNNSLGTTIVNNSQAWEFDYSSTLLPDGSYSFSTRAIDEAGNVSLASEVFVVVIDSEKPSQPNITSIGEDTGISNSDFVTNKSSIEMFGTAEPGTTVSLMKDDTEVLKTTVDSNGDYKFDLSSLELTGGVYYCSIVAEDLSGNRSEASVSVRIQIDMLAPEVISIVRSDPNPTERSSVNYTVNFSEIIYNLKESNFYIALTGTQSAGLIGLSQTSGTSVTATVSNISGEGSFRLDLVNMEGVIDIAGNELSNTLLGEVYNTNSSPTDINLSNLNIDENNAEGGFVAFISTNDIDTQDDHTYSLVSGEGDENNTSFVLVGKELRATEVFDFEAQNVYQFRLQTNDERGGVFQKKFVIEVNDVAEAKIRTPESPVIPMTVLGATTTFEVAIHNDGDANLLIDKITYPTAFGGRTGGVTVSPGSNQVITFTFSPTLAQMYSGDIVIESNGGMTLLNVLAEGTVITATNEELSSKLIQVFPNPASDKLNLDLSTYPSRPLNISIRDIHGIKYYIIENYKASNLTLDISKFKSGIYLILLESEEKVVYKKLIIER